MTDLKSGDRVRIKRTRDLGPTLWEVVEVDGFFCMIREANTKDRPQQFDTSLLQKVK